MGYFEGETRAAGNDVDERACSAASFLAFTAGYDAAAKHSAAKIPTSVEQMINLGKASQMKASAKDGWGSSLAEGSFFLSLMIVSVVNV